MAATQVFMTEAEKMVLTGSTQKLSGSYASGGAFIRVKGSTGATGTLTTGFTGESGAYDIVVKYFDENDGVSDLSVGVQGTTVEAWKADQNLGSGSPSALTLTKKIIKNVQINTSDKIEIKGTVNAGESAGVDRIDLIPTDNAAPTPSLTANNIDVTSGDTEAYTFTVQYSDNWGVDLSTLDSKDIKVTGPNGFSKAATLVSSSLSSNGKVATATYEIAPPGSYWNIQETGTYTIEMQSNQVLDLVNNPVAAGNLGTFDVSVTSGGDDVNYSEAPKGVYINLETEMGSIPDASKTLKIMPLGDSITAGKENSNQLEDDWVGYRKDLYEDFQFFNVPIDLVGSEANGAFSENQNEGHPGWRTIDITAGLKNNNWIQTADPDVILLMIGTNDTGGSVDTMKKNLGRLIETITDTSKNPSFDNGNLLVSTIAPMHPNSSYYSSRMSKVIEYNNSIPDIVAQQPEKEKVSFVNMWQGSNAILETDITPPPADNGLHPTQAGYQKMAYHWFDSILNNTQQKDILADKTNVQGSAYNDMIFGNASSNNLEGGEGADQITGAGGADTFTYNNPNQGQDTLTDFNPSQGDVFAISASGFGGGLVAGTALSTTASSTGVFVSGTALNYLGNMAHFFYNTSTGLLSFDPDGSNAQPLTPLATLTTKPTLTANQFTIV